LVRQQPRALLIGPNTAAGFHFKRCLHVRRRKKSRSEVNVGGLRPQLTGIIDVACTPAAPRANVASQTNLGGAQSHGMQRWPTAISIYTEPVIPTSCYLDQTKHVTRRALLIGPHEACHAPRPSDWTTRSMSCAAPKSRSQPSSLRCVVPACAWPSVPTWVEDVGCKVYT